MIELFSKDPDLKRIKKTLRKKIKSFESIKNKKNSDYTFFIIELQSLSDELEYFYKKKENGHVLFGNEIEEIKKIIEHYKNEQFQSCLNRSDLLIERAKRIIRK